MGMGCHLAASSGSDIGMGVVRAGACCFGHAGVHNRWTAVICGLSNQPEYSSSSRPADGAPTGPLLRLGGRRVGGLVRNQLCELSPKPQDNPCILARPHRGRVKEGKNMAFSIATEPPT